MLNKVEEILAANKLCVLCTHGGDKPHCSLMTYVPGDDLRILYMVSSRESRKFKNILANPRVSILVDTRQDTAGKEDAKITSITFEGIHEPLQQENMEQLIAHLNAKNPRLSEIINDPASILFGIRLKSYLMLLGPVENYYGDL